VKRVFLIAIATALLSCGVVWAQEGEGTVNSLSVNPRQNVEMTNTTGTESGQPTAAVPRSENQPNGLIPVTSNMSGSGGFGNGNQNVEGNKPSATSNANKAPAQLTPTMPATQNGHAGKSANTPSKPQK